MSLKVFKYLRRNLYWYSHLLVVLRVSLSRWLLIWVSSDLNHVIGSVFVNWEV